MIRKTAASLMLCIGLGYIAIGCGDNKVAENDVNEYNSAQEAYNAKFNDTQAEFASVMASHTSMPVADMDEAAKAQYEANSATLSQYEQDLKGMSEQATALSTKVTEAITAGNQEGFTAAWTEAKSFFETSNAKLDEIKNALDAMNTPDVNVVDSSAANNATTDESAAAPADAPADAPATDDSAHNEGH